MTIPIQSVLLPDTDLAGIDVTRRGNMYYICDYIRFNIIPVYAHEELLQLLSLLDVSMHFIGDNSHAIYDQAVADLRVWAHNYSRMYHISGTLSVPYP